MSVNRTGATKRFRLDLSTAREGKIYDMRGRFVKVVDSSSAAASVSISVDHDNEEMYQRLQRNGHIYDGQAFARLYVSNEAQPGEWVIVIVTDGPDDYDAENPSLGVVEGITDDVKVVNPDGEKLDVDDANTQSKLDAILALMVNAADKRAPLTTLEGAVYVSAQGANPTIVTAVENVSGVIIRSGYFRASAGTAGLNIDGNPLVSNISTVPVAIKDFFIPAGVEVVAISSNAGAASNIWCEVL